MEKTWNYLIYSTWRLLRSLGEVLIERPLSYVFNFVPFLRDNWKKGQKDYQKFVNGKDVSVNIAFAFGFMFMTTTFAYGTLCLYLVKLLNITVGKNLRYYFIGVFALAYATNYLLSWRSDKYKKYFDKFDEKYGDKMNYLGVILFHLGIAVLAVLSIHWIIGFNL